MINIGDRVAYQAVDDGALDECGTVVEPTERERAALQSVTVDLYDVLVEWDDDDRCWESPQDLVVVRGAGS